ncbi:MAG: thioredoxin [Nanoarchaeota archaeon]|nr:thioredoxin [Nanoarchaeota archaeon]
MAHIDIKSEDEFNTKVLESDKVTVVDFWAPWCGPCKMFSPVFERVAGEVSDVQFVKVNVDEVGEVAQTYQVMSIPTILLIKDGKVIADKNGAMSDDDLKAWIEENSGSDSKSE